MTMTLAQARVADPVLSNHARGYANAPLIGTRVFPIVDMPTRRANRVVFRRESFRRYQIQRAPGADIKSITIGYDAGQVSLRQFALSCVVPIEHVEEAAEQPGIDLQQDAVDVVSQVIRLEHEIQCGAVARTFGSYAATNRVALSGAGRWSDPASNPQAAVLNASEAVRRQIGRRPNALVMGGAVYAALASHPTIRDYFKYTGTEAITEEMLARYFRLDEVIVGDAIWTDDGVTMLDVWGGDAILFYKAPANAGNRRSMSQPGYGYTYRLRNYPVVTPMVFDRTKRSWLADYIDEWSVELVGADAGYLFQTAVA